MFKEQDIVFVKISNLNNEVDNNNETMKEF